MIRHYEEVATLSPAGVFRVLMGTTRTIRVPAAIRRRLERARFRIPFGRETCSAAAALHHSWLARARWDRPRQQCHPHPAWDGGIGRNFLSAEFGGELFGK